MDQRTRDRVRERLLLLRFCPRKAAGVTDLVGREGYRMRIGDYRALFVVSDEQRIVLIARIVRRNEATY